MAFAYLVAQLFSLHICGIHLLVECIGVHPERRQLCVKLPLQHLHLAIGIVKHLCRSGSVSHQFLVSLLVLLGLCQLLAGYGYLLLLLRFLTLIYAFHGFCLFHLQPQLCGVDESYLPVPSHSVTLLDIECQQGSRLLGINRSLSGLKYTRCVILALFSPTGIQHKCYTCHRYDFLHLSDISYCYSPVVIFRL